MTDKLVLVDGNKIRNRQDIEFPIIARRQDDPRYYNVRLYIPKGEVWVDYPYEKEARVLLAWEDELADLGGQAYYAKRAQGVKEVEARRKKEGIQVEDVLGSSEPIESGARLFIVKGDLVRKYFDPDFIFGGHHYVYPYIPQDHVWVDVAVVSEEVPFVLLHENHEREVMKNGSDYNDGHTLALAVEAVARRAKGAVYPGDSGYDSSLTMEQLREQFRYHK